jgi:hypothetical protein
MKETVPEINHHFIGYPQLFLDHITLQHLYHSTNNINCISVKQSGCYGVKQLQPNTLIQAKLNKLVPQQQQQYNAQHTNYIRNPNHHKIVYLGKSTSLTGDVAMKQHNSYSSDTKNLKRHIFILRWKCPLQNFLLEGNRHHMRRPFLH